MVLRRRGRDSDEREPAKDVERLRGKGDARDARGTRQRRRRGRSCLEAVARRKAVDVGEAKAVGSDSAEVSETPKGAKPGARGVDEDERCADGSAGSGSRQTVRHQRKHTKAERGK